jgi:3-oxoisoapionate kinase
MSGPPGLLLTFYGDDFTGSTDAMEALTLAGLRTVLFFSPPAPELLESRFADLSCMGVAGTSRAMSPAEMDRELMTCSPEDPLVDMRVRHQETDDEAEPVQRKADHRRAA